MTYEQLEAHFGGPTQIAVALGIKHRQVPHKWRGRRIPAKWQLKAEAVTSGKLKADKTARSEAYEYASYVGGVG